MEGLLTDLQQEMMVRQFRQGNIGKFGGGELIKIILAKNRLSVYLAPKMPTRHRHFF